MDTITIRLSAAGSSPKKESVTLDAQPEQKRPKMAKHISMLDSTDQGEVVLESDSIRLVANKLDISIHRVMPLVIKEAKESRPTVHDVAACILIQCGEITAMKLQKLVYYCQAWSLVWDEKPLFDEEIQAWANGPVVPALYERHKGLFKIARWEGNPAALSEDQCETVRKVAEFYGSKSSQWLSDLTHLEGPWLKARDGLGPGERGNSVITHVDLFEYYSSL